MRADSDVRCASCSVKLRKKVRCHDADEFARRNNLRLFPEPWKMALVACEQVVGAGGVGTLQELVILGILRYPQRPCGVNEARSVLNELEELLLKAFRDFEFRSCQDFAVFGKDGIADVKPGRFGDRKNEDRALESILFQCRRDEDIRVKDEPERNHRQHGSTTVRLLRAGNSDDLVDLARREFVRALAPGLFSDESKHVWLWGGQADVVADTHQHSLRSAALFDD